MKRQDVEEAAQAATFSVWALIGAVLVITALLFFFTGYVRPRLIDMQRAGNQNSQQYVETQVAYLWELYRDYNELETDIDRLSADESNQQTVQNMRSSQVGLLDQMQEIVYKIPVDQIPEPIKTLLIKKERLTQ